DEKDDRCCENYQQKLNKSNDFYLCASSGIFNHKFHIDIIVNNRKLRAIIDSGSDINIIDYKLILNEKLTKSENKIFAANNTAIPNMGKLDPLEIIIENTAFKCCFYAANNFSGKIIGKNT
ncbi:hypothetical protein COBT_004291, partial [Conglomerata obtusa]